MDGAFILWCSQILVTRNTRISGHLDVPWLETTSKSRLVASESGFRAGSIGLRRSLAGVLRYHFGAPCAHLVGVFPGCGLSRIEKIKNCPGDGGSGTWRYGHLTHATEGHSRRVLAARCTAPEQYRLPAPRFHRARGRCCLVKNNAKPRTRSAVGRRVAVLRQCGYTRWRDEVKKDLEKKSRWRPPREGKSNAHKQLRLERKIPISAGPAPARFP
jgi:hypothetical protein